MAPAASLVSSESSPDLVEGSRASNPSVLSAEEPLESELREELRKELRRSWYACREDTFGGEMRSLWTSGSTGYMLSIDGSAISSRRFYPSQLRRFCNKSTVLYWAHSAQMDNHCPRFIWGCIYKEWFRCYNQAPRLDFEHFFANPVCVTSTGPTTILEVLETHTEFYNRTFLFLDRLRRGGAEKAYMNAWPDQFKLLPICRAIIVVLDELVPSDVDDRLIYLDLEVQRQNILMVRTGNEIGLSGPISFDSIRELALPLARPDLETSNDIEAIRVPLATAIQYIVNLQRREEVAFPESALSTAVQRSLCPLAHHTESYPAQITNVDDWIDRVLEFADEKGIDNVRRAREALLTVQAGQQEEDPNAIHYYFGGTWR